MKLWLVRHGQTEANVAGLYSGHAETALTPVGVTQAQAVGTMLRDVAFDRVLCSALGRAQHTARLVLDGRYESIETDPRLNEMFFGDWEMRHHRDLLLEDPEAYRAWCADWQNAVPTNGESFTAFAARVDAFIETLSAPQEAENILIVSHQGVLSLLIARLLDMPGRSLWHFLLEQGAWSRVARYDGFTQLQTLNNRAPWRPSADAR
ncbi:adenosylcobalamin/alpha-ribazole phosphatase [Cronobacter turicensis]|uniref:Alpha-ribazole phosphatase n=1 Tax=Cronobacter turicensis (strain DSM 18703 / CCUG 55852 / LMG 23827 / z3032) TaxID=693216 RepID=C9XYR6_CROTZ|nr:adenosylcobalamin/alpha-ribazole phosphatase [Cronobacter turicensis]CBA29149.1 Alpha-ribazole phosphatase [Cronobacter turicensis z3032]EKM0530652.1 adenosylcobalamin/alpha-ribazole phosphatase [Cronobacter turicensis]EKM5760585.1 adenosylcobalamin/alpha-ribazole phosphatase [Cronobacter turicensis]ELY3836192.1 adenosylcobalamin/alpha-ribazole phosphatase [Cronobacter turicensis]ELY5930778.1 adenosylcobalamin/alpha-ribazole phosphatase [Cronobacter turicensis]